MVAITNALDEHGLETLVNDINSRAIKSISISGTTLTYTLMDGSTKTCTISDATTATKIGSSTVGGTAKPVYVNSGTPTAISDTVGSGTKPIYSNSGTLTASSSTVGSSTNPVYLSSGTITACGSAAVVTAATSSNNGYVKFSNNVLIQWGSSDDMTTNTFPISFSSAPRVIATHSMGSTSGSTYHLGIYKTSTTFYIKNSSSATDSASNWIAVGIA